MDAELTQLETQVEQLIGLYESLKAENRELRSRVGRLEADNRSLSDKVKLAADKLEAMLEKLPEA
jgi:cell division protein ZapB